MHKELGADLSRGLLGHNEKIANYIYSNITSQYEETKIFNKMKISTIRI